jgi:hypothetical protein
VPANHEIIASSKTRWLAVITGCVTAAVGFFTFGLGVLSVPIFLIAGGIIQPRFPRIGNLMCAGALWLCFWVLDIGILMLRERHPDVPLDAVDFIIMALVLLVSVCDLGIVIEEVKIRRTAPASR